MKKSGSLLLDIFLWNASLFDINLNKPLINPIYLLCTVRVMVIGLNQNVQIVSFQNSAQIHLVFCKYVF